MRNRSKRWMFHKQEQQKMTSHNDINKGLEQAPPTHRQAFQCPNEVWTTRFILKPPHSPSASLSFFPHTHQDTYFQTTPTSHISINMVAQTAEFKKAVEDSRKLKAKPSDDELLQVNDKTAKATRGE